MPAVAEPKIAGDTGEEHEVRLSKRLTPSMPEEERVLAPEESAGHSGQVDRQSEMANGGGERSNLLGMEHGLTPHQEHRTLRLRETSYRSVYVTLGDRGDDRLFRLRRLFETCVAEEAIEVAPEIAPADAIPQRRRLGLGACALVPRADDVSRVQDVRRALDENRPWNASLGKVEGLLEDRRHIPEMGYRESAFHVRPSEGQVIDVL